VYKSAQEDVVNTDIGKAYKLDYDPKVALVFGQIRQSSSATVSFNL